MASVKRLLGRRWRTPRSPVVGDASRSTDLVNDFYNADAPSAQAAVDLFANEWSSILPDAVGAQTGGSARLFEAPWVEWLLSQVGSIQGQRVLELGPLECGNTYMLEQAGAGSVVAVEANSRAFLRCLIVKNLLELNKTKLLFGDFVSYLETNPTFDVVLASGVLYHMQNPLALLVLATRAAPTIMVWTHYYDLEGVDEPMRSKFDTRPTELSYDGHRATGYTFRYGEALAWKGFCGGPRHTTVWLEWPEIVRIVQALGFQIRAEQFVDGANGRVAYFVATRTDTS